MLVFETTLALWLLIKGVATPGRTARRAAAEPQRYQTLRPALRRAELPRWQH